MPTGLLTEAEAVALYQPIGAYLTQAAADPIYLNVGGDTGTGQFFFSGGAGAGALHVLQTGDSQPRWYVQTDGMQRWGGGGATDTTLQRSGAGTLALAGHLTPEATNARDLGATALRWRKTWAVDGEFTNAPTVGGVALLTASQISSTYLTQANAASTYLTQANATSTYVPLAGGSVMTGALGPTTTNTRDLGTSALRWRKDYLVDGDYSGSVVIATALTVASKAVALSPNANQTLQWLANGYFHDGPTKATYDALVARVAALEAQMGAGVNGHYHLMGTWRQTQKATLPSTLLVREEAPAA